MAETELKAWRFCGGYLRLRTVGTRSGWSRPVVAPATISELSTIQHFHFLNSLFSFQIFLMFWRKQSGESGFDLH